MNKYFFFSFIFISAIACKKDVITTTPTSYGTPTTIPQPAGFTAPPIHQDNPQTLEGQALGRRLFFDKRLSGDNSMSCGSCHFQDNNFGDPRQFSVGIDGTVGTKNAMILTNLAWADFFFWNGREHTLEEQVQRPVEDVTEMKSNWDDVIAKIEVDPMYQQMFTAAFGPNTITRDNSAKALAQFIRTMVSGNSRYDQGKQNNFADFSKEEKLGKEIFFSEVGDCFHCHGDAATGGIMGAFGDLQFSNNGLDSVLTPDSGYEFVTGKATDRGKFKIPSLRNVEYSFPFMHDGRFVLLQDVIDHYSTGAKRSATLDPLMEDSGMLKKNFTVDQKEALFLFLKTLSDVEFLTDTAFSDPFN